MAQIYAGTSGWAYPSWKPAFYPEKLAQKKFLSHYATQLNTVEVNFTFRQLVKETTVANWIAETPAGFRLGIKAHQVITHIKRLQGAEDFVPRFFATIQPLAQAGKLGPVLFQLPPNMKFDLELLRSFLTLLPRAPCAFEFRNKSWFVDDTWNALRERNVALCVAETEEFNTPDVTTADFAYYRYRKPTYSADERKEILRVLGAHIAVGHDAYAYFKHEETPEGALCARQLLNEGEVRV